MVLLIGGIQPTTYGNVGESMADWMVYLLLGLGGLLHFFCSTGFESGGRGFAHVNQNCMQIGRQIVSTLQAQCSMIQSSHFETFGIFIGEPQEIVMRSGRMKSR